MIRFLADENFHAGILRGLLRRLPQIDIFRVQDVGLTAASDVRVLEWCAEQDRILITHDVSTTTPLAWERIDSYISMPGIIVVPTIVPFMAAIEDLVIIAECGLQEDFQANVVYLPLR